MTDRAVSLWPEDTTHAPRADQQAGMVAHTKNTGTKVRQEPGLPARHAMARQGKTHASPRCSTGSPKQPPPTTVMRPWKSSENRANAAATHVARQATR
jgi:hypothetical protein